ncbi:F-box/kelch-repeat protein [Cardamine amara subsp. amara]|uniref:F-box/kelch-repeat protein n=1 Tax=Cardamine amara subsp. amara TaxID=228776 RepID=A0ABD0ZWY7_CARAN
MSPPLKKFKKRSFSKAIEPPQEANDPSSPSLSYLPDEIVLNCLQLDDVIYAFYFQKGLMWFDVRRKVWDKVIGVKGLDAKFDDVALMTEYDGKLVIFWSETDHPFHPTKKELRCVVMALDWVGEEIRGTIEWSGIVATMPNDLYEFHNCFVISDD